MATVGRQARRAILAATVLIGFAAGAAPANTEPPGARAEATPLRQAHAHNDYEHDRPLHDALDHGFTSVEADVWLVGDDLLVGHTPWELDPERTLTSLYLDPLRARVADGGDVYPGYPEPFHLLVDVKSDAEDTYAAVDALLRDERYAPLLTRFADGVTKPGAISVTISGNRSRETMEGQDERYAFYDGSVGSAEDLGADPNFVPLVSDDWGSTFDWSGDGEMPQQERDELHRIVDEAHAAGQRVRFWATPDSPGAERERVWRELVAADVDHINTDDLAGLRDFLSEQD